MPQPRFGRRTFIDNYFPPGLKWLIISNVVVFVLYFRGRRLGAAELMVFFALYAEGAVRNLFVWQIFTYMFLHGGIHPPAVQHVDLWFFGTQLERDWGTRRFLKYYFLLRNCGGRVRAGGEHGRRRLGASHDRRFRRDFRRPGGVRRPLPESDRADELSVPDQSQVHGDDLCRHRAADDARSGHPASAPSRISAGWRSGTSI